MLTNAIRSASYSLHLSAWSKASIEIVRALVDEYPEAVHVHDKFGRTPLHISEKLGHQEIIDFFKIDNAAAEDHIKPTPPTKLKTDLTTLIEQQMWYDVVKCNDVKSSSFLLQSVLKQKPPLQVVKKFLTDTVINLDEINLAIDVASEVKCSEEVMTLLRDKKNDLFPCDYKHSEDIEEMLNSKR